MAKQLLPLNSKKSMIQETVERLLPLAKAKRFWAITNDDLRAPIVRQLKKLNKQQVIAEPVDGILLPPSDWQPFCSKSAILAR